MPNRFQSNQHRIAYNFIASRDGEYCLICRSGPGKVELQIDHADNNQSNWEPYNLHLLCQVHNLLFRGVLVSEKLRIIQEHSANNEREREKQYGSIYSKVAKDTIDYQAGSSEMKANSMFEPVFTEWLLQNLPMPKSEAINSGALIAGCSQLTCDRYLKKLTSALGPLREFKNGMNIATVDFKADLNQPPQTIPEPGKACENSVSRNNGCSENVTQSSISVNDILENTTKNRKGYQFRPPKGEIRE